MYLSPNTFLLVILSILEMFWITGNILYILILFQYITLHILPLVVICIITSIHAINSILIMNINIIKKLLKNFEAYFCLVNGMYFACKIIIYIKNIYTVLTYIYVRVLALLLIVGSCVLYLDDIRYIVILFWIPNLVIYIYIFLYTYVRYYYYIILFNIIIITYYCACVYIYILYNRYLCSFWMQFQFKLKSLQFS